MVKQRRGLRRLLLGLAMILLASWLIRFWPYSRLAGKTVILGLGSRPYIEEMAARLARQSPDLEVMISSGSPPKVATRIFERSSISNRRVTLDYRAQDTLTNLTTMLPLLEKHRVDRVILLCEDWRVDRARALASVILGVRGIAFEFAPYQTLAQNYGTNHRVDHAKILRDRLRAYLWLVSGWAPAGQLTGEGYIPEPSSQTQ